MTAETATHAEAKVVGERIRILRDAKPMTQKKLGEALGGKSRSAIAQWENGNSIPNLREIRQLADILNSTAQFIAFGVQPNADEMISIPVIEYEDESTPYQVAVIGADTAFIRRMNLPEDHCLRAVTIRQKEVMAQYLRNGDRVIMDTNNRSIDAAGEAVVIWDNGPVVAELSSVPGDPDKVLAMVGKFSFQVERSKLIVLGRAVSFVARVTQ